MSWDIFGTEREALRKKNSELLNEKFNAEYENKKLKQQIKQLKEELEELNYYKNLSAKFKEELDLACRANDVLQHKVAVAEEKLTSIKASYDALQKSNSNTNNLITENIELGKCISEYKETIRAKNEKIKRLNYVNSTLQTELENTRDNLEYTLEHCHAIEKLLKKKEKKEAEEQVFRKEQSAIDRIKERIDSISQLSFAQLPDDFKDSILTGRLANALDSTNLSIQGQLQISATIRSDEHFYNTTLSGCSCPDFQNRHIPCKHMLFLSYTSGLLLLNSKSFTHFAQRNISLLNAKIIEEKNEFASAKKQNKLLEQKKREHLKLVARLGSELDQSYPWLAGMYRRFQMEEDKHDAYLLSPRSSTSKQIVKKLKKSNADLKYEKAILENQLTVYETLFPWLEEFKKVDVDKAVEYVSETQNDKEYDKVSDYLSPAEYKALSITKKNQLALDRYKKHRKSDWEIGIDYERYIGYRYETQGYKVKYTGAIDYIKDMGRDLICSKDNEVLVIQCKRWSAHKTIHEKHIFQLYGSVMQLKYMEPDKTYKPLFYTTTKLSEVAKFCANQLGIEILEKERFNDYPCIKCNISKNGEKIYHLPFDQQYDRISIEIKKGECYVATVEEAENKGFRRAFKHNI